MFFSKTMLRHPCLGMDSRLRFLKKEEAPLCCVQSDNQVCLKIKDLLLSVLLATGCLFYFTYSLYFKNVNILVPLNAKVFIRKSIISIRNLPPVFG